MLLEAVRWTLMSVRRQWVVSYLESLEWPWFLANQNFGENSYLNLFLSCVFHPMFIVIDNTLGVVLWADTCGL